MPSRAQVRGVARKRASETEPAVSEAPLRIEGRLALRPVEAARALGLSERTLREILPQLPHLRAGTAVLIPVDLLREWLRDQAHSENAKVDAVVKDTLVKLGLEK